MTDTDCPSCSTLKAEREKDAFSFINLRATITLEKERAQSAEAELSTLKAKLEEVERERDRAYQGRKNAFALLDAEVGLRQSAEALLRDCGEDLKTLADRFRKEADDARRFVDGGGMNRAMAREFIDQAYVRNDAANRISALHSRLHQAVENSTQPKPDHIDLEDVKP